MKPHSMELRCLYFLLVKLGQKICRFYPLISSCQIHTVYSCGWFNAQERKARLSGSTITLNSTMSEAQQYR